MVNAQHHKTNTVSERKGASSTILFHCVQTHPNHFIKFKWPSHKCHMGHNKHTLRQLLTKRFARATLEKR